MSAPVNGRMLPQERPSRADAPVLVPGATIGVLGGGQLGRMLALEGVRLGYRFTALDPAQDAPCGAAAEMLTAAYDDAAAAHELGKRSDVITYEFENVSAEIVERLEREAYVPQGSHLLRITQHRLREKEALAAANVPVAPYAAIGSAAEIQERLEAFGGAGVLKTATGGYDGKGQRIIRHPDEAKEAYQALSALTPELVLEEFIPFELELSVIAARSPRGEIAVFPVAENIHRHHILHMSIVPARIAQHVQEEAERLARRIAESLDVVGLIAVEMFLTADGRLLVNELAPRPHNSGHYTMDACRTSQFEQHLRAICNLPLGSTELHTPVIMVNLLGEDAVDMVQWFRANDPAASRLGVTPKLHWYGKSEAKAKRKMGHINILGPDIAAALEWMNLTDLWRNANDD
ncbi:5-(carboxyamino)imidazole ribonucleotide synthase [Paenibacillus alvei]|uniref:5-(carboxyamino)imidazole ribonucleotide synthase n=2 Tax=Paenibacillus alvei TaxID=44250 RepID=UPI0018CDB98A|nr:5-(carboxyamino)imidazole ribonucleotide synthase [Paenibacillus alvei]MCY9578693.1 5-(carboxyamino)imidazole ribonucleotide synthase [Paenibacillus alvei]MCY9583752.1 5-(carboxyamino)imidazole ribonucleotide synthase [Paenibacillus alvei]